MPSHGPPRRRLFLLASALLAAALVPSCRPAGRRPVFPVTGAVYYLGRPAEGALVAFHPSRDPGDRGLCPQGVVGADGSFGLTTYTAGDGAPAGAYVVTLYRPAPGPDDDVHVRPDKFRGRYADPRTTPLTATVPERAVALDPLDLK